jgi:hypothetical protein
MNTLIAFKLDMEHYKDLKKMAEKDYEGNMSLLIKSHLPIKNHIKNFEKIK